MARLLPTDRNTAMTAGDAASRLLGQFSMFCTERAPPETSSPSPATVLHPAKAANPAKSMSFFIASFLIPPDIGLKPRPVAI